MLLDTSAWIDFFEGNKGGGKVKEILENEKCYTSIVSIAEIVNWCVRNNLDKDYYIKVIENNSFVINLKKSIVILAGRINFENKKFIKNWGMLDSFIYATARIYNIKLLTSDHHFKDLQGADIL